MKSVSVRETKQAERERELDREIEEYRELAWMALEQLEWAIGYLRSSGVAGAPQVADAMDRKRNRIATGIDRRGSHRRPSGVKSPARSV